MPTNPWVAVHSAASPSLQARELRRNWDDYLTGGHLAHARPPIAESWHRSQAAGIDPSGTRAPTLIADRRDVRERWRAHPLEAAAPLIRRWLGPVASANEQLIVVSGADGLLLWLDGAAKVRSAAADTMNFVEGALWNEADAGTNAIGTALATDHPVEVHAAEHFSEIVHGWTCTAVPVHDPHDGRLLGVIDLTGQMATAHPLSLSAAVAAARAVEAELRVRAQARDARLRSRYLDVMAATRGKVALVGRDGTVIADHPDGLLRAGRIVVPPGGGTVVLPGGRPGCAEALDHGDAFLIRAIPEVSGRSPGREGIEAPVLHEVAMDDPADLTAWRRSQLELSRLAEEQAALRRVATLVAGQATADEIFAAVAEEVAHLLRASGGSVRRYEADETMTVIATWTTEGRTLQVGTRVELEGHSVAALVQQLGRPSRIDTRDDSGLVKESASSLGAPTHSTVGAPIVVDGRVWGAILANSTAPDPFPGDTESRLMGFAELVATSISNAVARAELNASRARIVTAADEGRRRIEHDLHDGAQQRLVSLALGLRVAAGDATAGIDELRAALARAADAVAAALDELREISRGIHPAILSTGGLAPALRALSRRSAIPVKLEARTSARFPEPIELASYYVVSELLTNASKHAFASAVSVAVEQVNGSLHLSISDNGVGGADPAQGSGLIGLYDRVDALGGTIVVDSPVGSGTSVRVSLPVVELGKGQIEQGT